MARKLTHSGQQEAPLWHKEFYRMGDEADDPRPSDDHRMHPVVYSFGNGSGGKRRPGNNPRMPRKNLNPDHEVREILTDIDSMTTEFSLITKAPIHLRDHFSWIIRPSDYTYRLHAQLEREVKQTKILSVTVALRSSSVPRACRDHPLFMGHDDGRGCVTKTCKGKNLDAVILTVATYRTVISFHLQKYLEQRRKLPPRLLRLLNDPRVTILNRGRNNPAEKTTIHSLGLTRTAGIMDTSDMLTELETPTPTRGDARGLGKIQMYLFHDHVRVLSTASTRAWCQRKGTDWVPWYMTHRIFDWSITNDVPHSACARYLFYDNVAFPMYVVQQLGRSLGARAFALTLKDAWREYLTPYDPSELHIRPPGQISQTDDSPPQLIPDDKPLPYIPAGMESDFESDSDRDIDRLIDIMVDLNENADDGFSDGGDSIPDVLSSDNDESPLELNMPVQELGGMQIHEEHLEIEPQLEVSHPDLIIDNENGAPNCPPPNESRSLPIIKSPPEKVAFRKRLLMAPMCRRCGMYDCPSKGTCASIIARCGYRLCRADRPHCITVCPTLNNKCNICWIRGHDQQDCHRYSVQEKFTEFEVRADDGAFTKLRHEQSPWGFFHLPLHWRGDPLLASYQKLCQAFQLCPEGLMGHLNSFTRRRGRRMWGTQRLQQVLSRMSQSTPRAQLEELGAVALLHQGHQCPDNP
jgi:hypothetical protein